VARQVSHVVRYFEEAALSIENGKLVNKKYGEAQ